MTIWCEFFSNLLIFLSIANGLVSTLIKSIFICNFWKRWLSNANWIGSIEAQRKIADFQEFSVSVGYRKPKDYCVRGILLRKRFSARGKFCRPKWAIQRLNFNLAHLTTSFAISLEYPCQVRILPFESRKQ